MEAEGCLGLGFISVILIGLFIYFIYISDGLSRDGFEVIEKHETYMIVKKEGHQYIATKEGMYGTRWQYEHYPNCPCKIKE